MADEKSKTVNFNAEGIEKLPKEKPVGYKIKNAQSENIYTGTAKRGGSSESAKGPSAWRTGSYSGWG